MQINTLLLSVPLDAHLKPLGGQRHQCRNLQPKTRKCVLANAMHCLLAAHLAALIEGLHLDRHPIKLNVQIAAP